MPNSTTLALFSRWLHRLLSVADRPDPRFSGSGQARSMTRR